MRLREFKVETLPQHILTFIVIRVVYTIIVQSQLLSLTKLQFF